MSGENAARALMAERVARLREEISAAAKAAGRKEGEISLCAVCKTRSSDTVKESALLPVDLFGENHAQELSLHLEEGAFLGKPVHFIGHLQTNKVKKVAGNVSVIESADSLRLLLEINKEAEKRSFIQDVFIEINAGREESKSGVLPEELFSLCGSAEKLEKVRIRGLMTIPPANASPDMTERYFAEVRELAFKASEKGFENADFSQLSMGMSGSFAEAVKEGATIVRIGTGIYGPRYYPPKTP